MDVKAQTVKVLRNPALCGLYRQFGGLSEFYAFLFATAGITLAFLGKLEGPFAAMIVSVQGILCAHDSMDDYFKHKKEQSNGVSNPQQKGTGTNQS
jgi:hypothetical protein